MTTQPADEATTDLAAVLAVHERRSWSCACRAWTFQPRTSNYGDHDARDAHAAHVAGALAPYVRQQSAAALDSAAAEVFRTYASFGWDAWRNGEDDAAKVYRVALGILTARAEAERRGAPA